MTAPLPRTRAFDSTLALLREGYDFVSNRCDRFGTDAFRTRLMLRPVICLRGPEAAGAFYRPDRFTRKQAMPRTTMHLLQDVGSVQSLSGPAHRRRKAMFTGLLLDGDRIEVLAAAFDAEWRRAEEAWLASRRAVLLDKANGMLARAARDWAGVPAAALGPDAGCGTLDAMVANAGRFGPRAWIALRRRRDLERRLQQVFAEARAGRITLPAGSPIAAISDHEEDGQRLSPRIAAVELLNLLRPILAVSRYVVFAAIALERHPHWRARIAAGERDLIAPFAEEVRRVFPFFPVIGGVVREPFEWSGIAFPRGQWGLLDLYGTCHDPRAFPAPERFDPGRGLSWRAQSDAFIPQGAGDVAAGHRCPGEWAATALLSVAVERLCGLGYRVGPDALRLTGHRFPPQPADGFAMRDIVRTGSARPARPPPAATGT